MAKKLLWAVLITTLVVMVILITLEQYYVAVALLLGIWIMQYREIWALATRRRVPPADERVRENAGRAIRNGFIFFAAATAFLMLPFGDIVTADFDTAHVLGALFLSSGLVYMLSYLFYDRIGPKMARKRLNLLKVFLLLIGMSLAAFIIGAFLHNAVSALFDVEELVFFIIAVVIAPLAFAVGLLGSLVLFVMGLVSRAS